MSSIDFSSSLPPADAADAPKRRQRRKDARPQEMLQAALELFAEKGYAATRLDDIAARVGVSKGTVYLYFDSKEALFQALIRDGALPILEAVEGMVDALGSQPARDLLRSVLYSYWEGIGNTPLGAIHKVMVCEARNFPEIAEYYNETYIRRGRGLLKRVLELGIARGEFRAVNPEVLLDVVFAPMMMLTIWRNSVGLCAEVAFTPDQFIDTHLDLLLNGGLVAPAAPLAAQPATHSSEK